MLNEIYEIPKFMVPPPAATVAEPRRLDLQLIDPSHPERATAEAFVKAVFMDAYDARLSCFYPLLMSILWPGPLANLHPDRIPERRWIYPRGVYSGPPPLQRFSPHGFAAA